MAELAEKERQAIEHALFAGQKIEAIKLYHDAIPGSGLADAKQAVETMEAGLREKHPEKFTASRKKGCVGLVALLVALGLTVGLAVIRTL